MCKDFIQQAKWSLKSGQIRWHSCMCMESPHAMVAWATTMAFVAMTGTSLPMISTF
jgi:hypothetical protein